MKEKKTILKTINDDIFGDISIIESTKLISFRNIEMWHEDVDGRIYTKYDWKSLIKMEQKSIEILAKNRLFFKVKDRVSCPFDTDYLQKKVQSSSIKDKDLLNVSAWNSLEKQEVLFVMSETFSNIKHEFIEKYKNIIKGINISIEPVFLNRDCEGAYNYDKKAIFAYRSYAWLEKIENQNDLYYTAGDNFIDGQYISMIPKLIRNDEELDKKLLKQW